MAHIRTKYWIWTLFRAQSQHQLIGNLRASSFNFIEAGENVEYWAPCNRQRFQEPQSQTVLGPERQKQHQIVRTIRTHPFVALLHLSRQAHGSSTPLLHTIYTILLHTISIINSKYCSFVSYLPDIMILIQFTKIILLIILYINAQQERRKCLLLDSKASVANACLWILRYRL